MEDRRSIAKKAAIGVALVIAAAGAVLFYKNNIAMNPGDTMRKMESMKRCTIFWMKKAKKAFQKKNLSREIKIFIKGSGSKRSMLM